MKNQVTARKVSLVAATSIVVADIIGTGIFTSLGFQVGDLPSGFVILCLWDPANWAIQVHGCYPGPIPIFKHFYQPKLAELYRTTKPIPLNFVIGYRHHPGESTLMVATRKPLSTLNPQPSKPFDP